MNRQLIVSKLEELKQKSETTIDQIDQFSTQVQNLREEALRIQGAYQEFNKLLGELPEDVPTEATTTGGSYAGMDVFPTASAQEGDN